MRRLMFALLGLTLAGTPALAGKRSDSPTGQRAETARQAPASQATKPVTRTARLPAPGRVAGQRRPVMQRAAPIRGQIGVSRDWRTASASTAPVSTGSGNGGCRRVQGVSRCGGLLMSWSQGLPPAAGVQATECPAGTMATLAEGHDDVVRCMPL